MMLKYLLEKEFKQMLRNRFMSKLLIALPLMTIVVFPYVTNQEVNDVKLSIVDLDHSPASSRLTQKAASTDYFRLTDVSPTYPDALKRIEAGDVDLVLEIPPDFEHDLQNEGTASVRIAANSVNGTQGSLGAQYLASLVNDYSREWREENGAASLAMPEVPTFDTHVRYRFNPMLDYKVFMVPGLIVVLLTLLGGALTALNIVGEKEAGTIEQINVSPIPKHLFILSKLIPNWIIGLIALTFGMTFGWAVHGIVPEGSLGLIFFFSMIYIGAVTGAGMVISNYSDTMQQAMFVLFFFLIMLLLTSGLFTPVDSMPLWMQRLTILNPIRYQAEVMRLIYLKGSAFGELLPYFFWLCGFAVIFNTWAVMSYRKSL